MAIHEALLVAVGAFAGGFVSGLAGFGTGLIALGFWLHAIEPPAAASLVIICSVVSQAQTIPSIRHAIVPARIWPFIVFGLAGVPIGTGLVAHLDPLASQASRSAPGSSPISIQKPSSSPRASSSWPSPPS